MQRTFRIGLAIGWLALGSGGTASLDRDPQPLDRLMQMKLGHMQAVLSGIVLEDFGSVAQHAQALAKLTEASRWSVLRTPEYKGHSANFRETALSLLEPAGRRDVDATAQGYVALALQCVQCHKYVRSTRPGGRRP